MNYYEAIKVNALKSVLKPDSEYFLRKIFRWYSKTFSTPLLDVYDLPLEHVLQEFYEERYEAMDDQAREEELADALETADDIKARMETEDLEKVAEFQLLEMSKTTNVQEVNKTPLDIAINNLKQTAKELQKSELPDIDIKFEDAESFEKLLNGE